MSTNSLRDSELVLSPEGAVYHLNAFPDDIADTIITVGDPDRVASVSRYFDKVEVMRKKREFVLHTGWLGKKRITVASTGIGVDNVDITLTEIDALVNVDFETRQPKTETRSLDIIRLGTCGGLQPDLEVDQLIVSNGAFGLDNLMHYYIYELTDAEKELQAAVDEQFEDALIRPYAFMANDELVKKLNTDNIATGITATCSGFYGPQGRTIRAVPRDPELLTRLRNFNHNGMRVLNFEMETSAIFGLGELLGHRCCSVNVIVANRSTGEFSADAGQAVNNMIQTMLAKIEKL